MRISTTGNALSLTFVLACLPLMLLHLAGAGGRYGPMAPDISQIGAMGPGWMMGGAPGGGWHMAAYGYGGLGLVHVMLGAVIAYAFGWYVAAVFVSLHRFFERRAGAPRD